MPRTYLTAWKTLGRQRFLPAWRLRCYRDYVRKEKDDLGVHIAKMYQKWRSVRDLMDGVTDHEASRRLIDTLPTDWRDRAEQRYNQLVTFNPMTNNPQIDYQHFTMDMFMMWVTHGEGVFLEESNEETEEEESGDEEAIKEDPEEEKQDEDLEEDPKEEDLMEKDPDDLVEVINISDDEEAIIISDDDE